VDPPPPRPVAAEPARASPQGEHARRDPNTGRAVSYVSASRNTAQPGGWYLTLLSSLLFGYALFGRGFAYLGLPPLFVGEVAFLIGLVTMLRSSCLIAVFTTLPCLLLAAAMIWTLLRTLPFVATYGFDALRDSVVIMYGGFAFILISLLLEDGRRINIPIRYYDKFVGIYVTIILFLFLLSQNLANYIPKWPLSNTPIVALKAGEVATHLAGAVLFALVGFRRLTLIQLAPALAAAVVVSVTSRGAMLAFVVPIGFAAIVLGKTRALAMAIAGGLAIFSVAIAIEASSPQENGNSSERSVSSRQIADNVISIFGQGGELTEGTKRWREDWWRTIINDTVYGSHFWTGRGFGLNLGEADGIEGTADRDSPLTRSPHSVHMTILARSGIPGLALWALFLLSWLGMLAGAIVTARRRGQHEWAGLFLFIGCYVASSIINASFDVALEGPTAGIWFWCLIGFGIGSVMVYRCQPAQGTRRPIEYRQ
jgi:hypothetical protein